MKLYTTLKRTAIAMAATVLTATQLTAQVATVTEISGFNPEFNVTPVIGSGYGPGALVAGGFETFCIDRDINISIPGVFYYNVDTNGIIPFGLQLSKGAAYLYSLFASNTLS